MMLNADQVVDDQDQAKVCVVLPVDKLMAGVEAGAVHLGRRRCDLRCCPAKVGQASRACKPSAAGL